MTWYYSASERAFFSTDLMTTGSMPSDKVAVTDTVYKQLMADQVAGKLIRPGSGNAPESASQKLTTASRFGDVSFGKVTATGLDLNGNADISGTLVVTGASTLKGALAAQGGLTTTTITATGTSTLAAVNASNISASGTLKVNGASTLKAVSATNVTASGTLAVTGTSTFTGKVTANGGLTTKALTATSLDLNGAGDVSGNLSVGGLLTVTGSAVTVPTPTASGHAATKAYVDSLTTLTDDGVQVIGTPNYNNLTAPGFYHCNSTGAQNGPGFASKMIVLSSTGDAPKHIDQIAFPIYSVTRQGPSMRMMNAEGNWTDWRGIALTESAERFICGDVLGVTSSATKGTTPSAVQWSYLSIQDSEGGVLGGNRLAMFGHRYGNDGGVRARMACYKPESGATESVAIDVGYRNDGTTFAFAPAPASNANSTEIVTAGWANGRYLALDGSKVMTGKLQLGENAPTIISFQAVDTESTVPSVSRFNGLSICAKNNARIAYLQLATRNSGVREWNLAILPPSGGTAFESFTFGFNASDDFRFRVTKAITEESDGLSISTTKFARENGGSYWGIGNYAPSVTARESWTTIDEVDKTGFYSVGSGSGQKVTGTILHIQRQWEAGANGFQLNFGEDNAVWMRSRDTSYTADWNSWVQIADRDWVLSQLSTSQLSTSGEETHICPIDQAVVFKRSGTHICGSVHVQMYRDWDSEGQKSDTYGLYRGSTKIAEVTVTCETNVTGGSGHGRDADITLVGYFETDASIPAGSSLTLKRDVAGIDCITFRVAFAHVTVSNA